MDLQSARLEKLIRYGVVVIFVLLFISGLICLIEWRNKKLLILGRLKE